MSKIDLSIIIPAYNCEKYISKCLESMLKQNFKNFELIIINDGSCDNTLNVILEYANVDERIVIINQENGGPAVARNKGIIIARGEYIGFVDGDDYVDVDMFKKMIRVTKENSGVDLVMCGYIEENADGSRKYIPCVAPYNKVLYKDEIKKIILPQFAENRKTGCGSLWNKFYRKEFLKQQQIMMDESREYGEDWLFNIEVFDRANSCYVLEECLYHYVQVNNQSLMRKKRKNQVNLVLTGRAKLDAVLKKNNLIINQTIYSEKLVSNFFAALQCEDALRFKDIKEYCNTDLIQDAIHYAKDFHIIYKIFSFLIKHKMYHICVVYLKLYNIYISLESKKI